MSRVSVMTGLNRKEIRKIRDRLENEDWDLDPALSKPVSVLAEWFTGHREAHQRSCPLARVRGVSRFQVWFVTLVEMFPRAQCLRN